jgi:hypothetical protein
MFSPPGYVPFSRVASHFHEWVFHLVKESLEHGDPLSVGSYGAEGINFNRYCTNLAYRHSANFLTDCQSTAMCGFDGTLLQPDSLGILQRIDSYWDLDWFRQELIFSDIRFFFVDPDYFTITLGHWEKIYSEIFELNVRDDWFDYQFCANSASNFEGWALCISEKDNESVPDYIVEQFGLPSAVLNKDMEELGIQGRHKGGGRPPLSKAKAEFSNMNFDKGDRSWEQLSRLLEQKTGEKPSPRTLRTWMEEGRRDLPPRE